MAHLLNFDQYFSQYTADWMKQNAGRYANVDEMEAEMPELYLRWLNTPANWLDGDMPGTFFRRYSDAGELVSMMDDYIRAHVPIPDPLLERITDLGEAAVKALLGVLPQLSKKRELGLTALGLLRELDAPSALEPLLSMLESFSEDTEVADMLIESLQALGQAVMEPALARLDGAKGAYADRLLDICVQFPGHDAVYKRIAERFLTNEDRALYASYLGKYGDERGLPLLMAVIDDDTLDYIEYLEIRNAIEQLGGTVENERDFSGDPLYESLRGVNG